MTLDQKVYTTAKHINRLGNGAHAALRRGQITGEFWVLLQKIEEAQSTPKRIEQWHTLMQCIALAGHNDTPFGLALQQTALSDARVTRLLDANPEAVPDILLRIARRMRSQNVHANWTVAFVLMTTDKKQTRYQIAQSYYSVSAQTQKENA